MPVTYAPFINADWPAPANVRALTTLRYPGASQAPYASFNLGSHVGDVAEHVLQNRMQLQHTLQLTHPPTWLNQVHGNTIVELPIASDTPPTADGSYTQSAKHVCTILTADCLPILLCDLSGTTVCALHVGWRGLVANIIENAIAQLPIAADTLLAWLGPAISASAFEIGDDVKHTLAAHTSAPSNAFTRNSNGRWYADLPKLATARLQANGVTHCFGGGQCTASDPKRFYSYRRDGQTGRQASLIWLTN